ncbi:MAG: hypothetical protein F6K18_20935 [Okeania sp. SIO2C2]|uniref:hypothetical protein n=1 Tax=Okeania sp. SIO2C2 TaxID=2607787 RepID=UPI0013BC9399|nr:hypothetical protein [Okeania sp. SIO2C2]NEP89094.1 hypothetical protein [Okeania sp. SIO2C2]
MRVGVRSQESGEIGIIEEVVGYICPLIFPPLSAQNPHILNLSDRKAGTFFTPKKLKPLSVNALRVNQPALCRK